MNGCSATVEGNLGALEHGSVGQRRHEATRHEVVELELLGLELLGIRRTGRMDRRMVGRLLLASGRRELPLAEQALHVLVVRGDAVERLEDARDVQALRVHRVVDSRVRDQAVHVQRLGDAHRAGRREPFVRCCRHAATSC